MNCPKCGETITPNNKFCPNCGLPLSKDILNNDSALENGDGSIEDPDDEDDYEEDDLSPEEDDGTLEDPDEDPDEDSDEDSDEESDEDETDGLLMKNKSVRNNAGISKSDEVINSFPPENRIRSQRSKTRESKVLMRNACIEANKKNAAHYESDHVDTEIHSDNAITEDSSYDPNFDGFYDDVQAMASDVFAKTNFETILKIVLGILFLLAAIVYLILA